MSLINQMLQELDARRADVGSAGELGQQVRAVPERHGIHPAWWLALALALVLSSVLAWIMLRPPVQDPVRSAQLPLKLDLDLSMGAIAAPPKKAIEVLAPPPAASMADSSQTQPTDEIEPAVPSPKETAAAPTPPSPPSPPPSPPPASRPVPPQARPTAPVEPRSANPVAEPANVIPDAKMLVPALGTRATEPVGLHKQVKELTSRQHAENEYRKAVQNLQQGRSAEAMNGLEQALQLDAHHAGARQALIGLLLDGRRPDRAMAIAREGLDPDLAQPGLAMILARLQLEKGELDAAIETLGRTLPHASDRADYQAFLAALLQRDEKHGQAAEHYLLALQRAPQNGVWWMGLGISLQAENRKAEAQEAFKRAKASNTLSADLLAFVDARLRQLAH